MPATIQRIVAVKIISKLRQNLERTDQPVAKLKIFPEAQQLCCFRAEISLILNICTKQLSDRADVGIRVETLVARECVVEDLMKKTGNFSFISR